MNDALALQAWIEPWVLDLLRRHDAVLEPQTDGATFTCLPHDLQERLALPEAAALRVLDQARAGEVAVALEGATMQGCLDLALARGSLAAGRLAVPVRKHEGLHAAASAALQLDNAAVRAAETRRIELRWLVLEFVWIATADERASGSVFLAHEPHLQTTSPTMARVLLAQLADAEPAPALPSGSDVEAALRATNPAVEPLVHAAIAPFVSGANERFKKELRRLATYYDKLLIQAQARRGRSTADPEALAKKRDAITRDRDQKRAELAERFAVRCEVRIGSALSLAHEGALAEFVVRRKTRERTVAVAWDPWSRRPLARTCEACGVETALFHACDDAVHLVCAGCRAPKCVVCQRHG
jgi:hypothetical protein